MAQCRDCNAPVIFVPSEATGRLMIVDALPAKDGNIVIVDGKARVLPKDLFSAGEVPAGNRYFDHHVNCPHADKWRKKRK